MDVLIVILKQEKIKLSKVVSLKPDVDELVITDMDILDLEISHKEVWIYLYVFHVLLEIVRHVDQFAISILGVGWLKNWSSNELVLPDVKDEVLVGGIVIVLVQVWHTSKKRNHFLRRVMSSAYCYSNYNDQNDGSEDEQSDSCQYQFRLETHVF